MFFGRTRNAKYGTAIGLDFGSHQWKAVALHRTEQGIKVDGFVVVPSLPVDNKTSVDQRVSEALQALHTQLKTNERRVYVSFSTPSAWTIEVELPSMPINEVRGALNLNSARYLRRDLAGCCFDVMELQEGDKDAKARKSPTMKVLVAGAPREEVMRLRNALQAVRLHVESIELSVLTVINSLQRTHAALCEQEVLLLLDIGARQTSLNFLRNGQPMLTRLMPFGGMQISERLVLALGVSNAEADRQKCAMTQEMAPVIDDALQPLAREIRSSIDYVERQFECEIRHAFAGGGSAGNELVSQRLSTVIGLPIAQWNPLEGCTGDVPDKSIAPSFAGAVGVAISKL
jgi:type IV pilus assembly protein PilM